LYCYHYYYYAVRILSKWGVVEGKKGKGGYIPYVVVGRDIIE